MLLSASSFALLLTEYVVKGGILIGSTNLAGLSVYHAAIFGIVYWIVCNIRLTVCIGMGITMVYALIDHYVTVFRGTPVLLSDLFAVGTAKNVAASYSVPVELSVLQTVAIAALFCSVWVRRPASAPRRWQFAACSLLMGCWLYGLGLAGNSFGFWQGNLEYSKWYYFCRTAENAVVKKPAGYSVFSLRSAGRSDEVFPVVNGQKCYFFDNPYENNLEIIVSNFSSIPFKTRRNRARLVFGWGARFL